jgi:hypothetical protein
VELNASFYRWPREASFRSWRRRLPDGFRFSVKAPRGLTHAKRLYAPEAWVGRIAAGWHELGPPRAVLLVQLAPDQARDDARLGYFLDLVPPWIRVAVELRHPSWNDEAVFAMLERHGAASCVMSGAGLPCVLRATAPFVYVRLHGPTTTTSTRARTPTRTWGGGPTGSASGTAAGVTSSPTSTTTATATPCATPRRCATCSGAERAGREGVTGLPSPRCAGRRIRRKRAGRPPAGVTAHRSPAAPGPRTRPRRAAPRRPP